MQEAQIVGDFLFPTNQESPRAVDPRMRAFNFPATCFAATMLGRYGFAVFWRNVPSVVEGPRTVERPGQVRGDVPLLSRLDVERSRLLDERHHRVLAQQQWEDIREDVANEREISVFEWVRGRNNGNIR